jgi:hypothetical protein
MEFFFVILLVLGCPELSSTHAQLNFNTIKKLLAS